jgi:phosphoribosylformylglycinamidine synthase II
MEAKLSETGTDVEVAQKLGLLPEEFEKITQILGRVPNFTELSIFSVMWSEHCSYKNSITWLKTLPRDGGRMLAKAGEENAGLMDIGDGLACAFKIESHNHPSALEPYQGAATGVGGINRDIFTMGARPIAQLNSLRFGNPDQQHTQWLVKGVVKGIGDYGNAFGVPTVGGEMYFDPCYQMNPLVNAMSAGIVKVGHTISATAEGPGNPVFIVGSSTGRDGIHGATFASADLTEDSAKDLPAVQVGDPFTEKLLLEATLEVIATGAVVGMQDMGAAGITCSTSEMSAKGGCGMIIHLDKVPTRQAGMKPFEILLSESQERMLVVAHKGREQEVKAVFDKWDLNCVEIGVVTNTGRLEYFMEGAKVGDVPAHDLVLGGGAPVYKRDFAEPEYLQHIAQFDLNKIIVPDNLVEVAHFLVQCPNLASRHWIYEQYDSMVGTATMTTNRKSDAAVVAIKDSNKALALTVDCNGRYVHANPEKGTSIAVAEAARNLVCSGAVPLGVTNCLNFGNPYNKEVYWQFVGAIKGMGAACRKFETPVTGGNVSFYNQSKVGDTTEPVFPTPTIGMVGLIEDRSLLLGLAFQEEEDLIYLLGDHANDINASEYLYLWHKVKYSPAPRIDLDRELALQKLVLELNGKRLLRSAHDCSEGGLFMALTESAMAGAKGCVVTATGHREDALLFGESQGRIIVSVKPSDAEQLVQCANEHRVPVHQLGKVIGNEVKINNKNFGTLNELSLLHRNGITRYFKKS